MNNQPFPFSIEVLFVNPYENRINFVVNYLDATSESVKGDLVKLEQYLHKCLNTREVQYEGTPEEMKAQISKLTAEANSISQKIQIADKEAKEEIQKRKDSLDKIQVPEFDRGIAIGTTFEVKKRKDKRRGFWLPIFITTLIPLTLSVLVAAYVPEKVIYNRYITRYDEVGTPIYYEQYFYARNFFGGLYIFSQIMLFCSAGALMSTVSEGKVSTEAEIEEHKRLRSQAQQAQSQKQAVEKELTLFENKTSQTLQEMRNQESSLRKKIAELETKIEVIYKLRIVEQKLGSAIVYGDPVHIGFLNQLATAQSKLASEQNRLNELNRLESTSTSHATGVAAAVGLTLLAILGGMQG